MLEALALLFLCFGALFLWAGWPALRAQAFTLQFIPLLLGLVLLAWAVAFAVSVWIVRLGGL